MTGYAIIVLGLLCSSCWMSPTFHYEGHWRPHRWEEKPFDTIWKRSIPYERYRCKHDGCDSVHEQQIPYDTAFINKPLKP